VFTGNLTLRYDVVCYWKTEVEDASITVVWIKTTFFWDISSGYGAIGWRSFAGT
jgi:hypothetical protein